MRTHNIAEFHRIASLWQDVYKRVGVSVQRKPVVEPSVNEALKLLHGVAPLKLDANPSCGDKLIHDDSWVEQVNPDVAYNPKCQNPEHANRKAPRVRNPVAEGTYRRVCKDAAYDARDDKLSCELGSSTLTMEDPFRCVDDININARKELQC